MTIPSAILCLFSALIASAAGFFAPQPQDISRSNSHSRELNRLQVLERLDRNQDGFLSESEIPDQVKPFVESVAGDSWKAEQNGSDPKLDLKKLRVKIEATPRKAEPIRSNVEVSNRAYAATLLNTLDSDRDGFLTPNDGPIVERMKGLDSNGDKRVSISELTIQFESLQDQADKKNVAWQKTKPIDFTKLDVNRDGQIQMYEYTSDWSSEQLIRFRAIDSNQNGVISLNEWKISLTRDSQALQEKKAQ